MTLPEKSDIERAGEVVDAELVPEVRPTSIDALGALLQHHQAGMRIDYLYDHGWQVQVSNPGGSTCVHACERDEKWPVDGGPSLVDTISKAVKQARAEGWW